MCSQEVQCDGMEWDVKVLVAEGWESLHLAWFWDFTGIVDVTFLLLVFFVEFKCYNATDRVG